MSLNESTNQRINQSMHHPFLTMKLIPLFFAAGLALAAPSAVAQVAIRAGVHFASMAENRGIDAQDLQQESIAGFQAAFGFDLGLGEHFTVQPELLFIQKGGIANYTLGEARVENEMRYNYFEIPVLAKIKFNTDDNGQGLGGYIVAGPYAGLALKGRYETRTTLLGREAEVASGRINFRDENADDFQRRLDWGVSAGVGLHFGSIFIDARYNLGINNLLDADAGNNNDSKPYLRNRGLGLSLGYEF
jgi:hypothetical protein